MKGRLHEQEIRERVAYIHGRIERELEAFAHSLAIPAVELTYRVGALLLGDGEGRQDRLPPLPVGTGTRSIVVAEVEGPVEPHGGKPRAQRRTADNDSTTATAPRKVKALTGIQRYWARFTPDERSRMMKARFKKWSPEAKASWGRKGHTKGTK
jgi:hypothetical protein